MQLRFPDLDRVETLSAEADGYHTLTTHAPPGTRYHYLFSGGRVRPDPASLAQAEGVHGPSFVMDRGASDSGAPLLIPPLADHVLYELHVGTFTPEGTFDAIIPRLPALKQLGVTAIELMPVAQFPGHRNWGYDGVGPFAVQWSYGGLPGLRRLVRACHDLKLAILLDVVYNHLGPEGNYLGEFGPYFTDRYKTPWGAAINFDGPDSDHVREFFIQNSLFWTRDCGIDGLRLDAVHAIVDHTASTFIEELTERNHAAARQQGRRVLIIAESSDNDPRLVRPRVNGGYALDGCWNDDYHHAIRASLTGERAGYYRPFGDPSQIAKAIRDRFVFSGEYSSGARRRHGAPARDIDHGKFVVFTQNHDQVGNRAVGDRLDRTAGLDGARVAAALVLLSPFTPMLWMGEEYAEQAPFQYFVSHSDADLIDAVRKGRAAEFAEFIAAGEVPDPQDEATCHRSRLAWDSRDSGLHAAMLAYYTELLRMRRHFRLSARTTRVHAATHGTVVMLRYDDDPCLFIVANTGMQSAPATIGCGSPGDATEFALLLDSGDQRWGGSRTMPLPARQPPGELVVDARTVLVFHATKEVP